MIDPNRLRETLTNARNALLAERNVDGHWTGELSTSALSTATALVALGSVDPVKHREPVAAACRWLVANQNADGGWGDTVKSFSNISTTLLCWSALTRFGGEPAEEAIRRAEAAFRLLRHRESVIGSNPCTTPAVVDEALRCALTLAKTSYAYTSAYTFLIRIHIL
jgi:squalene cyclase